MRITKFGHSCLLVEESGVKFLFDPGVFSVLPETLGHLDAVFITHEHQDHFDLEKLKSLLSANASLRIVTNTSVASKLTEEGIAAEVLEHGANSVVAGVTVEAVGKDHALIHPSLPVAQNTGYFIAAKFFHPGDAFTVPATSVEILALPVVAPWSKDSDSADFIFPRPWKLKRTSFNFFYISIDISR
jgi:L-ascorbate metabolism protein UlaG (beta-lactamase superfamily)